VAVRSGLGAGPAASWGPAPIQFGAGPAGELEVEARRAGDLLNEAGTSTEQPAKWADLAGVRFEPCAGPVRLSVRFRSDTRRPASCIEQRRRTGAATARAAQENSLEIVEDAHPAW